MLRFPTIVFLTCRPEARAVLSGFPAFRATAVQICNFPPLIFGMCVLMFTCRWLYVCSSTCTRMQRPEDTWVAVPRELKIIYFELGFLTGSGNHQGGQADWPASPKHLPISTSPVLGSQVCTRAPGIFKTWLLGM